MRDAARGGRLAGLGMLLLLGGAPPTLAGEDPATIAFFEQKIRPVLVERCVGCHGATKVKGGLRLDSRDALRGGGTSGPAVAPGDPDESLLLLAIGREEGYPAMPPDGPLPAAVVADFRAWVAAGAADPRDGSPPAAPPATGDAWWSLQPVVRPAVPAIRGDDAALARNPIDAFILDRLRAAGIAPAPEADRRTLVRRLHVDLLGLPPTPGEVAAFLADARPDAYERLVDRLLASTAYGERRARQWMDLVHFAETHGHDQDRIRPNAWPYRDYLIHAFNDDTPYARFVAEQVAADALFPGEPARVVALGFLAAGPWDESSLRDIREDTLDRQIGRTLDRDDMIATTFATFASTTVHCARCHDHKFDPITQADYYGLQAVFAGVDRAERAYDADPAVGRRRAALTRDLAAIEGRDPAAIDALLVPDRFSEVLAWATPLHARLADWTTLATGDMRSASGTILERQADGSILATGPRPARDTYTIVAPLPPVSISALRIELLPDDRLPARGPGRNDNGNLHLTELRVAVAPEGRPGEARTVAITRATADFDQDGWGVAAAIDANPQTAWGIYPAVGAAHEAVFELAEGVGDAAGRVVAVELEQSYPENHPIGRFRLSVGGGPRPVALPAVPAAVAGVLAIPPDRWDEAQRREVAGFYHADRLRRELAALPPPSLVFAAAADFAPDGSHKPAGGPRPVHVLNRGDIRQPGAEAQPGALRCVADLPGDFALDHPEDEAARRAALARWLGDARNPLTWRSIVNRAWQQRFGRGLVDTPSDFGRMGARPTHPELLDWLAATFRDDDGGSLKALDRRIVTSAAYRRATRPDAAATAIDGDNRLLWRQNRRRLDAESVRDAALLAAGDLDRAMGGPSVRQFALSPGVHVTPVVDYTAYDWAAPGSGRRSVYRFLFRTLPDPFMEALDAADASQLTDARGESVSALQALALRNNAFMRHAAGRFAARLEREHPGGVEAQIDGAFALALARAPTDDERADWAELARRHGLATACRFLLNTSEFLYVD